MEINSHLLVMLGRAADELVGPDPIKEKLRHAAISNLAVISAKNFPPELRPRFEEIRSALRTIQETADTITEQEAVEIARKILELQRTVGD
jgi:hypothetical protein